MTLYYKRLYTQKKIGAIVQKLNYVGRSWHGRLIRRWSLLVFSN
jgi:hypothetical protein